MKSFSCLLLTGILVLLQACSPSVSRKSVFDVLEPATVLNLEQDTTIVLVRDYFPSIDKVDRTDSPNLKVIPYQSQDTVMIKVQEYSPAKHMHNMYTKNGGGNIPVRYTHLKTPAAIRLKASGASV